MAASVSARVVDAAGREVLGGGGVIPVEVHALGRELHRLWEATGEPAAGESSAVTRACTRNVVALCPDPGAAAGVSSLVAGVADRYPSRAFVVVHRADGPPERLEATLEAQCQVRNDGRHVCCEQINLAVGPLAGRRAASAIVPLLVPDLPVFVWSLGPPDWDNELLGRLLDVADRVLVDTRGASAPAALLADLSLRERRDRWSPADFEWARLADWREAVATLLEEPAAGTGAGAVPRLARVSVRHGAAGTSAAALCAGWILDRLEASGRPPADVDLAPSGRDGGIERIELGLEGGAVLVAERAGGGDTVRLEAGEGGVLPVRLPCDRAPTERLLEDLLAAIAAEPLYERALAHAARLLEGAK